MADTNLRQAKAKINTVGIVSEKNLKEVVEDGVKRIEGSITIKTSDINFIKYNVRVAEKTKSGADNKAYAGIATVMESYKSISEVGEAEADKVRVSGDINLYRNKASGEEVVAYKSNFFNRLRAEDEFAPNAEFDVEVFISSIVPEMDSEGEETGRVLVKGWVPTYDGIEPLVLVANNEDGVASAIEATYEPGQTVNFWGEAINNRVVITKEIPVAIGKPRVETKTTYKNELLITGASEAYEEGVTPEKPYEAEIIKAAIQERTNKIEEEKNKESKAKATTQKPSGAAKGRSINW